MSNSNHDLIDPAYIPWPKRASVEQYDIMLIDLIKKGKKDGINSKGSK